MNFRKTFAVLSCAALVAASANTVSLTAFAAENVYAKTTAYLILEYRNIEQARSSVGFYNSLIIQHQI